MISVIVPVYKVEKYLSRCVDSILNQTYKNFEIILVDDGSPDNCGQICDDYAKKDSRIIVIHKQNGGLSSARNAGIIASSGDWIYFVDSDDWIENNLVADIMAVVETHMETECILFGYYIDFVLEKRTLVRQFKNETNAVNSVLMRSVLREAECKGMLNSVWNKVYKRSVIEEKNIYFHESIKTGEDLSFNCEYFRCIHKCYVMRDIYYHYMRQGENTIVTKYDPTLFDTMMKINLKRIDLYKHWRMETSKEQAIMSRMIVSDVNSCIFNEARNNDDDFGTRKNFFQKILEEKEIKNAVNTLEKPLPLIQKIFVYCYRVGSPNLMSLVYGMLFWGRRNMKKTYGFLRKHVILSK